MTLSIRLYIWTLVVVLSFWKPVHAQITITSITPSPACVNFPITVTYTSLQAGTLYAYMYSASSTNFGSPKQIQTIAAGNNLTITIPATQVPGSYTIRLTNNLPSSTTYTSTSTVTVNTIPSAPTVNSVLAYCQGTAAAPLIATASSGGTLNWYGTALSGGIATSAPTTPSTAAAGTTNYYVSQSVNGCESPRAAIAVTVNSRPSSPSANSVTYCQGSTATPLTATSSAGGTLNWYTSLSGGTASLAPPIPPTSIVGVITFYVSQVVNGCESNRAAITVTIYPKPTVSITPTNAVLTSSQPSLTFTAMASVSVLSWSTAETTTNIIISAAGVYSVTATNAISCIAVASTSVLQEVYSVKMGNWDDPTVWSLNQVPTNTDAVRLLHAVSLPTDYQAQAGTLGYDTGGQLQVSIGSRIRLGP